MFELLVTDLDGTLLRSDKSISDATVGILRRCREKGVRIWTPQDLVGRIVPHVAFERLWRRRCLEARKKHWKEST